MKSVIFNFWSKATCYFLLPKYHRTCSTHGDYGRSCHKTLCVTTWILHPSENPLTMFIYCTWKTFSVCRLKRYRAFTDAFNLLSTWVRVTSQQRAVAGPGTFVIPLLRVSDSSVLLLVFNIGFSVSVYNSGIIRQRESLDGDRRLGK